MEQFDYNKFYSHEDISEMKLTDKITMKDIYENLRKNNDFFQNEKIEIFRQEYGSFDLVYNKTIKINCILDEPLNIKIDKKQATIISLHHLGILVRKNNINNPIIKCKTCNDEFGYNFHNINTHKDHDISVESSIIYQFISEKDFKIFFNKELGKNNIFGSTFKNPEAFEKNFQYYFKDYQIYQNKPFEIYKDDVRQTAIYILKQSFMSDNIFTQYFGQSGMGKSIVIIAISKYMISHEFKGTLYLNLKSLYKLIENKNLITLKQIIIDEIPYLFYDEYEIYIECVKTIQNIAEEKENENSNNLFIKQDKNEESRKYLDFLWNLISELLKFTKLTLTYLFFNITIQAFI